MPIKTDKLINYINEQIKNALPGAEAQNIMKPHGRPVEPAEDNTNPKPSAVLLIVYYEANEAHLVMIKRAEYNGVHSGQIAFPGGKKENQDKNLLKTALRETNEEIGVKERQIHIIGKLSPLYIPVSNMCVHPWLGLCNEKPIFVKQDKEVQEVISIPIRRLLQKETQSISIFQGENFEVKAPCYQINGNRIWGASAMILSEFLHLMKGVPKNLLHLTGHYLS